MLRLLKYFRYALNCMTIVKHNSNRMRQTDALQNAGLIEVFLDCISYFVLCILYSSFDCNDEDDDDEILSVDILLFMRIIENYPLFAAVGCFFSYSYLACVITYKSCI